MVRVNALTPAPVGVAPEYDEENVNDELMHLDHATRPDGQIVHECYSTLVMDRDIARISSAYNDVPTEVVPLALTPTFGIATSNTPKNGRVLPYTETIVKLTSLLNPAPQPHCSTR